MNKKLQEELEEIINLLTSAQLHIYHDNDRKAYDSARKALYDLKKLVKDTYGVEV